MATFLDTKATPSGIPRSDAAALAVSAATSTPQQRPVSRTRAALYGGLTEALARTLRTPQYLILFVSDRCWMRCAHCWFNESWKERELTRPPLAFEEYEKLARSIKQLYFLSLTGGEAFHRDDIVELATMFRKTCRLGRYQIPTSGYRTTRIVEAAERLLLANPHTPFRVDVSLDGVQAVHNGIRRIHDGFERAVETIKALNGLKRRYAHFDVGIITTISRTNQATVREIAAFVEEIHPDGEWMVNIARGGGRDPTATEVDPAAYRLAHDLIEARIARGAYKGHGGHWAAKWLSAKNAARRDIIFEIINGQRQGGGCAAGSLGGVVYSDGSVKVCEMLDAPLGNLRDFDYDLARIWAGAAARRMRHDIQATGCQCTQECFLSVSMLIQPDAWRRMTGARRRLARGQHSATPTHA
jgi:MoaA/NifB/PqqE/SkfB family radical SAM enzyme